MSLTSKRAKHPSLHRLDASDRRSARPAGHASNRKEGSKRRNPCTPVRKFRATVCLRGPVLSLRAYIGKVPFREFNQADQDDFHQGPVQGSGRRAHGSGRAVVGEALRSDALVRAEEHHGSAPTSSAASGRTLLRLRPTGGGHEGRVRRKAGRPPCGRSPPRRPIRRCPGVRSRVS